MATFYMMKPAIELGAPSTKDRLDITRLVGIQLMRTDRSCAITYKGRSSQLIVIGIV